MYGACWGCLWRLFIPRSYWWLESGLCLLLVHLQFYSGGHNISRCFSITG